jgi:hypothetical protein
MIRWLKKLFKKDADLFKDEFEDRWWESKDIEPVTRVGNGPEQTVGGSGGLGYGGGTAGDTDVAVVKDTTAVEKPTWKPTGEPALDQPIVWAPVGEVVVSKPKSDRRFQEAMIEKKKKGERKPKKLNKGLAAKAKSKKKV